MKIYQAIVLGAIQWLTEFLPISSSGHLAIATSILGVDGGLAFSVLMHFATLIPVCVVFRKSIQTVAKSKDCIRNLIIATIPAGIVGVVFSPIIERIFSTPKILSWSFLITALALILSQMLSKRSTKSVSKSSALVYGLFQAVAVVPGVSRSGACLTAGRICGVEEKENVSFAFIMSIPIILASTVFEGSKLLFASEQSISLLPLAFGFVSALIFGFLSANIVKRLTKKLNYVFGVYLMILSLILFIC